jgi:competence protein ComEA
MEEKIYEFFKKNPRLILLNIGLLIIISLLFVINNLNLIKGDVEIDQNNIDEDLSKSEITTQSKPYYVEIVGQVNKPGVYILTQPQIILEVIEMAGGFTEFADMDFIHRNIPLSRVIQIEQKVYIPTYIENLAKNATNGVSDGIIGENSTLININFAQQKELEKLSGVGEVTAKRIIENRPYKSLEEFKVKASIGDALYNKIVPYITI